MGLQKIVKRKKAIKFTANERALGVHKKNCSKHNKLETDISLSKKKIVLKSYKTAKRCGLPGSRDREKKGRKK